jgi:transcriptional regulator with XRE-family HTH domain
MQDTETTRGLDAPTDSSTGNNYDAETSDKPAAEVEADRRPWRDAETLERLYIAEELTTREIADRLGCTNGTVSKWLNHHDIPTRENWVAGVEAAKRANREERVAQRTLPSGYEYWASKEGADRTNRIVYVHRLLAVAEHGFDAAAEREVHHCNGIPWDNRPENIDLLSKSDHGRHHANQRWHGGGA